MTTLGERRKKARISAGITQKELAGNVITRNMLSQIENGRAVPSIKTLRYLGEKLGLPGGYFFEEDDAELSRKRHFRTEEARREYLAGNYESCYRIGIEIFSDGDDELISLIADSAVKLGIESYSEGRLDVAMKYLFSARDLSRRCRYDISWVDFYAAAYLDLMRDVSYVPGHESDGRVGLGHSELFQTFLYRLIMGMIDSGDNAAARSLIHCGMLTKDEYFLHVKARLAISESDYMTAIEHLKTLLTDCDVAKIDSVILFRIYSDLELCCKETEDYQSAYVYSGHKNSILERIVFPSRSNKSDSRGDI